MDNIIFAVSSDPTLSPVEMSQTITEKYSFDTKVPRYPSLGVGAIQMIMEEDEKNFLGLVRQYISMPDKKSREAKRLKKRIRAVADFDVKAYIKANYKDTYKLKGDICHSNENPTSYFNVCYHNPQEYSVRTNYGANVGICQLEDISIEDISKTIHGNAFFYDWDEGKMILKTNALHPNKDCESLEDVFKRYLNRCKYNTVYVFGALTYL